MAPRTSNLYGKIIISKRAIRHVVLLTCKDTYGVALAPKVKVRTEGTNIEVSISLYLRFGVTIEPVIESIRRATKYNVETFTGMTASVVNIDVLGIKM